MADESSAKPQKLPSKVPEQKPLVVTPTESKSDGSALPGRPQQVSQADQRTVMGYPIEAFVKGGTTTSKHDQWMAESWMDAQHRRQVLDAEQRVSSVPVEQGGAKMYTHQFRDSRLPELHVPLHYINSKGETVIEGVGDIRVVDDPAFPGELVLIMFCPRCTQDGRVTPDHAIVQIRQSNRYWALDERTRGEMFVYEGHAYVSAGTVMDCEKFTCPRCDWRGAVHKNCVYTVK